MDVFEIIDREYFDEYGPAKLIHIHEPKVGLKAIVCVHNTAVGPSIGGVRMASDVTTTEVYRLAQAMTFKNAMAGIRHGGGKCGIVADPAQPEKRREILLRALAKSIKHIVEYIPGPDMGTNERSMGYIYDEIGRAVGLPRSLGGIPLDEIGATGFGITCCAEVACKSADLDLQGSKVAIEGFGSVGRHTANFLHEKGAVIVAISDTKGTIYNPKGLDPRELLKTKAKTGSVIHSKMGKKRPLGACLTVKCDILIPAARPDSINEKNWDKVQAKLIVCGANIPMPGEIENKLHDKGVLIIPDFVANAGGVICGAVEYSGGQEGEAFPIIRHHIQTNTKHLLERVMERKTSPRKAALSLAQERIKDAMTYRYLH